MENLAELNRTVRTALDVPWRVCNEPIEKQHDKRGYLVAKRIMDFTIAAITFLVLLPVMALIALAIKLDSRGPVIFAQERVGFDEATGEVTIFKVYKFRTMRALIDDSIHRAHVTALIKSNGGPAEKGASLKLTRDPRITRVGRLLRKTSLDELPQLVNVLKGEMSLVGPRPALPYEVAAYEAWHMERLTAVPGMTGWWQIKGRNRVSFDDMVCMDVFYIRHRSLLLDVKCLLLTPWAVISTKGAG